MMPRAEPFADRVKYRPEAAQARESPGQWFILSERDSENAAWSMGQAIATGRRAAFRPAGAYETHTSGCVVYVRFVG